MFSPDLRFLNRFSIIYLLFFTHELQAGQRRELVIAAASSLKEYLEETGKAFEQREDTVKVIFQFGSSGLLRQQIEQGAPVDVFVSASDLYTNELSQKNLVEAKGVSLLAENRLVLVVRTGMHRPIALEELKRTEFRRIAIGEAQTVPAGQYAVQWMKSLGLEEALRPKLVPAANVRQVLSFVETGNVDAAFVYASDAKTSTAVDIALVAPKKTHDPITYPIAVISKSKRKQDAKRFIDFLKGPESQRVLEQKGFLLPGAKPS